MVACGLQVYAVFPNGTLKWSYTTGDLVVSSPALWTDGTVYIGSQDGFLYALWSNGTLRWRQGTGSGVVAPPILGADGSV